MDQRYVGTSIDVKDVFDGPLCMFSTRVLRRRIAESRLAVRPYIEFWLAVNDLHVLNPCL